MQARAEHGRLRLWRCNAGAGAGNAGAGAGIAPALATAVSAPVPSDANAAAETAAAAAPSAGRGHPGVGARPATLRTGPLSLKRLLADFGAYKTAFSGFFHDQAHHASHRVKWAAPKV